MNLLKCYTETVRLPVLAIRPKTVPSIIPKSIPIVNMTKHKICGVVQKIFFITYLLTNKIL